MKKKAGKGISQLKNLSDYVALAVVDADKYQQTNIKIIAELTKQNIPGVYVTLNRPYENVKDILKKQKIDLDKIIFIDGVTKTAGGEITKKADCLFIGGPKSLSDISIAMDQAIMGIPKKDKFLFFDSLSTLLIYNDTSIVLKFIHFLAGKMRIWKVRGIIISLRRTTDKDLIELLKENCDVIIDL